MPRRVNPLIHGVIKGNCMVSKLNSNSLDNEGCQTYVELRKLASDIIIWRTTLAVSGHLSLAWLTRNR